MNKLKISIFLILIVAVILILNPRKIFSPGRHNLNIHDTASVNRISISGKDTILLEKTNDGNWMLNGRYEVNMVSVNNLLYFFRRMSVKGISNNINPEDTSISSSVGIYSGRKEYLFRFYPAGGKNLLQKKDSRKIFSLEVPGSPQADLEEVLSDDTDHWRNHVLIDFLPDEISEIMVMHPGNPSEDFIVRFENNIPVLYEPDGSTKVTPEMVNSEKLMMYVTYFMNIFYDKSGIENVPSAKTLSELPDYIVSVYSNSGEKVKLSVFPLYDEKGNADIFNAVLKINDDPEILVTRYIVIDLILRKKGDLIK